YLSLLFFPYCYVHHRLLHSFPTTTLFRSFPYYLFFLLIYSLLNLFDFFFCFFSLSFYLSLFPSFLFLYYSLSISFLCYFYFLLYDRMSTRLNSSLVSLSYSVFCLRNKTIF